jgi:hypothetical protein
VCGDSKVEKAIMAPKLSGTKKRGKASLPVAVPDATATNPAPMAPVAMMSPQEHALRQKLKELREHLTQNADYVGPRFPEEARKMHYGETDPRSIYGEASLEDAKELHDEGIELHPLPTLPDERN